MVRIVHRSSILRVAQNCLGCQIPQRQQLVGRRGGSRFVASPTVRELDPGLWHWASPHPGWEASEPWEEAVSSYAVDDGERLLLFDPLTVPGELEALFGERETAIVLTAPWHERDAQSLVKRHGLPVFAPPPDTAQDLMDKYGITAEQAGEGSPDLLWMREADKGHFYLETQDLPFDIEVFPGREHNDVVLWIERRRAVISGDTLADFGQGLGIQDEWLRTGVTREEVVDRLRPLLELPVEHVLPAHGGPNDRTALERALAEV
jgi:glyoxylase-like metal-dependent hydrolase (beta-lactamase superfamily II)